MGFLFNSGHKEGKGVSASEPKKRIFFRFIDIVGRKYSQLIGLNIVYFLCALPVTAVYFLLSSIIVPSFVGTGSENYQYLLTSLSAFIAVFLLMTLGGGPVTAGFSYVIRNYAREEHAFTFSDFFEHTKKNFKQSIVITLIDFVLIFLLFININFYSMQEMLPSSVAYIARVLLIVAVAVYMLARMYLYPLMVTYECSIKQLFKYSFALAMLKLPQNILVFAINILLYTAAARTPFSFFMFFIVPIVLLSLTYMSQSMYTVFVMDDNIFSDKKEENKPESIFKD